MTISRSVFIFISFFIIPTLYAQSPSKELYIDGTITDDQSEPLPFAAVMVYTPDTNLIKGLTTDENGYFKAVLDEGEYMLKLEYLSYNDQFINELTLQNTPLSLDPIIMTTGDLVLEQVEITAQKSQMEFKLDKRVVNVGSNLANSGANVADLLDNIPSISLDIEGNVELRGSQNVRILVDGKPSGLLGNNVADALRQLQSDMVERVEIITNPSARYDAEGEVGIINIVMKKESKKGFNGSIDARVGVPHNHGAGINFNYRRDWINLFLNGGLYYRKSPGNGATYQEFNGPNGLQIYESQSDRYRSGLSNQYQFGADFFINDYNTLTASGVYRFSDGKNRSDITYKDYDSDYNLIQESIRTDLENENGNDLETSLSYVKTFKEKDRKLTADFKWLKNEDLEISDITEEIINTSEGALEQNSRNREGEENFLLQLDYVDPVGKEGQFEAGFKANLRDVTNNYLVEQLNENNNWIPLEGFDDNLIYLENIYAAYAIYGNKYKAFSYQFGLRVEHSDITTELIKEGLENDRNYTNFFPTLHFTYELNPENQFQLSYSRRLSRPWFRMLLPFSNFTDSRSRRVGNPDLNPEYSNSFETGFLKYFTNGSLLSSVYYRYRTGVIDRISLVNEQGIELEFPVNLGIQNAYGIEFSFNYDFTKWWQSNINLNFYNAITEGTYQDVEYNSNAKTMSGQASTKFKLPANFNIQASFNYEAPEETTQGRRDAQYSMDMGMSKDILKGKGTLILSGRDIFNTRRWAGYSEGPNFYNEEWGRWRARQITLNFNYRINQTKRNQNGDIPGIGENDDF
ncbi:TonB-dependent receptor domain-containing protein [Membranihabitans maritimus]|uniref:TonB-dependent receptor domain-containing protein n=1 Tax=Membranihabitans maritimus TaxID=2904244 RepID=UPI001F32AE33|nr:TonB-dependent receptor [Membranihabitans maritimus]